MQRGGGFLPGGRCVIAKGDHGLHFPGLGGFFPHPPGLYLAAPGTPALIQAVAQQRQRFGAARLDGFFIVLHCLGPVALPRGIVARIQFFQTGAFAAPLRLEQPVQDGAIQRSGIGPWVDDHTVDAVGVQGIFHSLPHPALGHGPGGRGALGFRRLHRSEQGQVAALLPGVEQPGVQPFRLFRRDGHGSPRGRAALRVGCGIQRHQHPRFQLQCIVQGVHQVPEMRLVLLPVEPLHGLLHHRAARARRAVLGGGLFLPAAHRAEPPCAFLVCHLHHPSFSIRHNNLL